MVYWLPVALCGVLFVVCGGPTGPCYYAVGEAASTCRATFMQAYARGGEPACLLSLVHCRPDPAAQTSKQLLGKKFGIAINLGEAFGGSMACTLSCPSLARDICPVWILPLMLDWGKLSQ